MGRFLPANQRRARSQSWEIDIALTGECPYLASPTAVREEQMAS
jgi:hypothetical protein